MVEENGSFKIAGPKVPTQVLLVQRENQLVLLGYVFSTDTSLPVGALPGPATIGFPALGTTASTEGLVSVEVNPRSTALALILLNPIFWGTDAPSRWEIAQRAIEHPKFQALTDLVRDSVLQGHSLLSEAAGSLYQQASAIAEDIWSALFVTSLDAVQISNVPLPPDPVYGHDIPWIEADSPTRIVLVNPKACWYVAGAYDHDTGKLIDYLYLDNRNWKWLQLPPGLEPPTRTVYELGSRRVTFRVHKGSPFSSDELSIKALYINVAEALLHVVDLFVPVRLLVTVDKFMEVGVLFTDGDLQDFSRILSIEDVFKGILLLLKWGCNWIANNPKKVCGLLSRLGVEVSQEPLVKDLAKVIGNLVSYVTKIDKLPFFWDLFTAPVSTEYSVEWGADLTYIPEIKGLITTPGARSLEVAFFAHATDRDGKIMRYQWDYDKTNGLNWDEETSSDSVRHEYSTPGVYTATLRVWDDDGSWAQKEVQVVLRGVAKVAVAVSPASVVISPGGYHMVTYTFRETGGCEVHLLERTVQFFTPGGEPLTPESGRVAQNITVPGRGETSWVDNIYLPPEVASQAKARGLSEVVLRARFYGHDCSNNQVSVSADLRIRIDAGCPDLVVQEIWIEPAQFSANQEVTVWFRAKNIGNADAGGFRIVVSLDGRVIDAGDVHGLSAGKELRGWVTPVIWPDSNCHTVGITLDSMGTIAECSEENNTLSRVFCPAQGCPDLAMEDIWIEPTQFSPGQQLTLWLSARNTGTAPAGPFRIAIRFDGMEIDSATVQGLGAGKAIRGEKDDLLWPSDSNCHTIEVILDPENVVSECKENNNRLSKRFCPSAPPQKPDLVVEKIELEVQSEPPPWTTFNVIVTIRNVGGGVAQGPFKVALYRFEQPVTGDWKFLGETTVSQLAPGESQRWTWCCIGMPDPPPIDWWERLLAIVDPTNNVQETNENNNTLERCFGSGCP